MTRRPKVIKETPVITETQPESTETRQYIENPIVPEKDNVTTTIQHVQKPQAPPPQQITPPPPAATTTVTPAAPKKLTAAEKRKENAKKKQQQERLKKMQEARKLKQQAKEEELERKLEEKILARLKKEKNPEASHKRTSILRPYGDSTQAEEKHVRFQREAPPKVVGRKRDRYEDENEYESSDNEDSKSRDYSDEEEADEEESQSDDEESNSYYTPQPRRRQLDPHEREYQQRLNNIRAQITQGRSRFYF